jgi:hypothetical protein
MGAHMLLFVLALLAIAGWGIYLQLRNYSLPVHADSGEFIYRGVLEREGERFQTREIKNSWKEVLTAYRHWSPSAFFAGVPVIQNKILVYRIMTWYFRGSQFGAKDFRLLCGCYHGGTILILGVLGELAGGPYAGLATAGLYAFFSASPFVDASQIHAEHFATLPVAGACACLLLGLQTGGWPWFVAAGFLLALVTILIKLTYGAEFCFLGTFVLLATGPYGLGAYLLGLVISLVLLALFYGLQGQGKHLYWWLLQTGLWIKEYLAKSQFLRSKTSGVETEKENAARSWWMKSKSQEKFRVLLRQIAPLIIGAGLLVINLITGGLTMAQGLVCFWGAAAVIAAIYQNKYYLAHTVPLLGPATLMTGMMIQVNLAAPITADKILSIFIICLSFIYSWPAWRPYLLSPGSLEYHCRIYKTLGNLDTLRALAVEPIAQYLREKTGPRERILQWGGTHQELYALAGRRAALDTLENHLLLSPEINDAYLGVAWRRRFVAEVAAMPPAYIADLEGSLNIEALSQATGLRFELDQVFYQMFPVYRSLGNSGPRGPQPDLLSLTRPALTRIVRGEPWPLKEFNDLMGRWFNQGWQAEADTLTQGGVTRLLEDWQSLNASGCWRRSCLQAFEGPQG